MDLNNGYLLNCVLLFCLYVVIFLAIATFNEKYFRVQLDFDGICILLGKIEKSPVENLDATQNFGYRILLQGSTINVVKVKYILSEILLR